MKQIYIVCRHWVNNNTDSVVCAYEKREDAMKRVENENECATILFPNEETYYAWICERNLYI